MTSASSRRPVRVAALVALVLAVAAPLAGCRVPSQTPTPTPSTPGATPRPFTVMSTDPIRVTDPAAITDTDSTVIAQNVFQRLMTADPGGSVLKPDAARDCLFTAATTYSCTLNEKLQFHNGHPLTSSDVKFSIERATRLDVPGSSASLLSSLRRIDTPDDRTVRFLLSRPDTQFGWGLASSAASLVDEEMYNADRVHEPTDPVVGSGPFQLSDLQTDSVQLSKFTSYVGRTPGRLPELVYRTMADSASIEDAMTKGTVEVVWRGLNAAAVTRLGQQVKRDPDGRTTSGYTEKTLSGVRVVQLHWASGSSARTNKALRTAIALALQGDRTSDSLIPSGVPGHVASFPLGGTAKPKVTWENRINLVLGYDPATPNAQDIAVQIRTRLENTGGLAVKLTPNPADADLTLVDRKAWTSTALAWLQPYLDAPLAGSAEPVERTETEFRGTTEPAAAEQLLAELQRQATIDLVMLPISQSDEQMYVKAGIEIGDGSFGPGWQLGLWGIGNG